MIKKKKKEPTQPHPLLSLRLHTANDYSRLPLSNVPSVNSSGNIAPLASLLHTATTAAIRMLLTVADAIVIAAVADLMFLIVPL